MKKVFNTKECIHKWAHQAQNEGRNGKGSVFFEGKTIYSYGHHFPMARIVRDERDDGNCIARAVVLITTRSYSNTTAHHLSAVRSACHHMEMIYCHDVEADHKLEHLENLKLMVDAYKGAVDTARNSRNGVAWRIDHAQTEERNAASYARLFHLEKEWEESKVQVDWSSDFWRDKMAKAAVLNRERAERNRIQHEAREARRAKEEAERLPKWRQGVLHGYYNVRLPDNTYPLRLIEDGKTIETGGGARVPTAEAMELWPILKKCSEEHRAMKLLRKIGDYGPVNIDENGNIEVGCHKISFAEMESMYQQIQKGA